MSSALCVVHKIRAYSFLFFIFIFRYRNFRTLASPRPVQFRSLALDSSGEVVAAGSHDTFEIFVWSMQTGRLLEVYTHAHMHMYIYIYIYMLVCCVSIIF